MKGGFDPAFQYELVFTAKDPLVLGIGFAATRDLNSFLRYADKDDAGTVNPVAKQIRWALSRGSSQSGNFIRTYINLGFNQDESGRIVWDGVNPHIAARQLALNFRFAVGGGAAGLYEPGSEAVLWWSDYPDAARHRPRPDCSIAARRPRPARRSWRLSEDWILVSARIAGSGRHGCQSRHIRYQPTFAAISFPGRRMAEVAAASVALTPAPPRRMPSAG